MPKTFSDWLNDNTLVRLDRSPIHGIGVFAIKNIPSGCDPFPGIRKKHALVPLTLEEINKLDEHVTKMVLDFCIPQDGVYYVYKNGFSSMDMSFFLNASREESGTGPNVELVHVKGSTLAQFRTIRDINRGEELLFLY